VIGLCAVANNSKQQKSAKVSVGSLLPTLNWRHRH